MGPTLEFPEGFVWGAATAGHQIEGNNVNASMWPQEWADDSFFVEPSGDACDGYHRYTEDIGLLADAGLGAYRFSIEWSRVEPEPGYYSLASLDHYRRVCEACLGRGVRPFVTLNHFTVPRWFDDHGGFANPDSVESFRRYAAVVVDHLGDLLDHVMTFNEANIGVVLGETGAVPPEVLEMASSSGSSLLAVGETADRIVEAHLAAGAVVRAAGLPVGWTLALPDLQAQPGAEVQVAARREAVFDRFLDVSRGDDFVGVQNYTRERFDADGRIEPPTDADLMETGWEVYPDALANVVRDAAARSGVPVFVTENGVSTEDDGLRIETTTGALRGLHACIADGVDVRGYFHWSLLDNFEWVSGYTKHFGLISVDRSTFERHPKPSLAWLGGVARANGLG